MATKEQLDELNDEANAVLAADASLIAAGLKKTRKPDYTAAERPGPTVADLKAAIRELATIARSHAPMMQYERVGELLKLAD